ncbi:hypothetical protein BD779DRAFT_1513065 [Infundibulicybe gibba]|nr:hypothetical protein BD779DRAFT_1513065 [Infundibulicybe gibba]
MATAVNIIADHIIKNVSRAKPLFVALQGPQGSGKSYLTAQLQGYLSSAPHSLRVVTLSIDDLYLPHKQLRELSDSHPNNILWKGRGLPGTHDIELGIPRFEKSLNDDESGVVVSPPKVDVVVMEGWCMGFGAITEEEINNIWTDVWMQERKKLGMNQEQGGIQTEDILMVNGRLGAYSKIWNFFDIWVQIKPAILSGPSFPSRYSLVYKWRLQQEHTMRAANGGRGMSDQDVKIFVDRYIPGYVFFGDDFKDRKSRGWPGSSLAIIIDETRNVMDVERF